MKRAAPLVFSFSALSLALLGGLAFVGTAAGIGTATSAGLLTDASDLTVSGSATLSDHSVVTLTYAVTNESALPILAIMLHGELYQGIDTVTPTGDPPRSFDCPLQDATGSASLGGTFGLLWLDPGASATCSATFDLTAGPYTAWLTASGYDLSGWPSPNVPSTLTAPNAANAPNTSNVPTTSGYAPPSPQPTPEPSCPAILLPADAPCPLRPESAQGAVPFYLLAPPTPLKSPSPPSPPPPPSQSPPPSPSAAASSSASTPPEPTTPPSPVASSPVMQPLTLEQEALPLPTRTEKPTQLFILIMVLPAVYAAAAVLARRR